MSINVGDRRLTLLVVAGAAVLGLAGGATLAQSVLVPAGVATEEGGTPASAIAPNYPTNAAGQTYGSLSDAVLPEDEPDLILVEATNGIQGYVLKETLDEVTGANVSSPAEAIEWQRRQDDADWDFIAIPVFESDGVAQIGSFPVSRSVLEGEDPTEVARP